jgi:hypothetical protein
MAASKRHYTLTSSSDILTVKIELQYNDILLVVLIIDEKYSDLI